MINQAMKNLINNQKTNLDVSAFSQTPIYCFVGKDQNKIISQENLGDILDQGTVSAFYTLGLSPDLKSGYGNQQSGDLVIYGTIKTKTATSEQDGSILASTPFLRFAISDSITLLSTTDIPSDKSFRFFRFDKLPTTKVDDAGNIVNLTDDEIKEYENEKQKTYYLTSKKPIYKPATTNQEREVAYYSYTFKEFSRQVKKNWYIYLSTLKPTQTIGGLPNVDITDQILAENRGVAKVKITFSKPGLLNNFEIKGTQNRKATSNFASLEPDNFLFNNIKIRNDSAPSNAPLRVMKLNAELISGGVDIQWKSQQAVEYNYIYKIVSNQDNFLSTSDKYSGISNIKVDSKARISNLVGLKNESLNNGSGVFNAYETDPGQATTINSLASRLSIISQILHHSFDKAFQGGKWNNGKGLFQQAYKSSGNQASLTLKNSIIDFNLNDSAQESAMSNPNSFNYGAVYGDLGETNDPLGKLTYSTNTKDILEKKYYPEFPKIGVDASGTSRTLGSLYMKASYEVKEVSDKSKAMFLIDWIAFYKKKTTAILNYKFKEQLGLMVNGLVFNQYFASNKIIRDFINQEFKYQNQPFQAFPKTKEEEGSINVVGPSLKDKFANIESVANPAQYYCLMEIEEQDIPWIKSGEASFGDRPSYDLLTKAPVELVSWKRDHQTLSSQYIDPRDGYYLKGSNTKAFEQDDLDVGLDVKLVVKNTSNQDTFTMDTDINPTSTELWLMAPKGRSDAYDNYKESWYKREEWVGSSQGAHKVDTQYDTIEVIGIKIKGTTYSISNFNKNRSTSIDKHFASNRLYRYFYGLYEFKLENYFEYKKFEKSSHEVQNLIKGGLWGMNDYFGLGSGADIGAIDKIGVLQERYFQRNKPQVYEFKLPTHDSTYGSLVSKDDGYALSEITLGAFCRGDMTIEIINTLGKVIKTQKIAGQKPGSANSKILSFTIKG